MTSPITALTEARDTLATVARDTGVHGMTDAVLLDLAAVAGDVLRLVEAVLVEATGEVADRSASVTREERLTTRQGCRDVPELLQRLTRCSGATAGRWRKAATAVTPAWDSLTGEERPAKLPAIRDALLDGEVGVDGVVGVAQPLFGMRDRVDRAHVLAADTAIATQARGEGPDGAPPLDADLLRVHAQAWAVVLDPDGAEPAERDIAHRRGITLGREQHGVVPIRGMLLPEVAAQFHTLATAMCHPRVQFTDPEPAGGDGATAYDEPDEQERTGRLLDARTRPQKLHDMFATVLTVAASTGDLPTVGGAAPTLVVSVRAEDLTREHGWGFAEGTDTPVTLAAVRHVGCAGAVQRVALGKSGRVVRLGTEERVFNRRQRRAIALRDGGCIIPGCHVPAAWCEIHHVVEHAKGGPTHTDNGVLLCWHHQRFIDTGPWRIRMNHGVPEVQAPAWYDRDQRWRPVTTSRTRTLAHTGRRT